MPIAAILFGKRRVKVRARQRYPHGFEPFEVVANDATGTALRIEVDVCDHKAVEAMVARGPRVGPGRPRAPISEPRGF
jgi:hypothetical protein